MNRREVIQQMVGMVAVSGVSINSVQVLPADTQPVLVMVELGSGGAPTLEFCERLKRDFEHCFHDAGFHKVTIMVHPKDTVITAWDRHGRVCNQYIEQWLAKLP